MDVAYETPVNLDLGERQLVHVVQARIPRAEVIQRDAGAEFTQHLDRGARLLEVMHDGGFGDLEVDTARVEIALQHDRDDLQRVFRRGQIMGREVEGEIDVVRPERGGLQRPLQQHAGHQGDAAVMLRHGNEFRR